MSFAQPKVMSFAPPKARGCAPPKAMKEVTIYADGACKGNPGPGGWGAVLTYKEHRKEISGSQGSATNQQMELTAAIQALSALKEPCQVKVYSDSQYLVKGMSEWIKGWVERGWRTTQRKPVMNQELWQKLLEASQRHEVEWIWVEGHAGHKLQERANELAQAAAEAELAKTA